ncbi:RNHCP domain-containing protein [Solibacillus sp. MA9]|uniref:RNHCP domain-containing protein n=1 Tax=Solibacillus palustris TaxID=2908203 RepID=A0ABS9UEI3_9BACL|nr:RNHCP domain-containing protein [Solibacillus sp. MA9]MCH7322758.1 RNHCP domain-containing protein [Solibacillus sp. MA9]
MSRKTENTAFQCENCHEFVEPLTNGSFRNHCPQCLFSKHLDQKPGDRLSDCKGLMKPIQLDYSGKKGYQIVHECITCGKIQRNKIAVDSAQEDNVLTFMTSIAHY